MLALYDLYFVDLGESTVIITKLAAQCNQSLQIEEESELIELLMCHHLVPQLVSTPHYPVIVQYLLTNQNQESESHDQCSLQRLAEELKEAGFMAEAGSLMFQVKSTPSMLQTFGGALGAISKWLK